MLEDEGDDGEELARADAEAEGDDEGPGVDCGHEHCRGWAVFGLDLGLEVREEAVSDEGSKNEGKSVVVGEID